MKSSSVQKQSTPDLQLLASLAVTDLIKQYRDTGDVDLVLDQLRSHSFIAVDASQREEFLGCLASALPYELTATLDELDESE